ncbi:MAG: phosphotriesterase-related protein [Proteobacteria bacterium]|nr:phosphotriesterase-related protein [Pseudomonadota bacterium]
MKTIQTVTGPIKAGELGKTLPHEHVMLGHPGWQGDRTLARYDRSECVKKCVEMAGRLKQLGVQSLVDATTNDYGRDPELLKEISEKSGLNIVCCTGYYNEEEGGTRYFNTLSQFSDGAELISELFQREVTEGIAGTGIKAGILKVATKQNAITDYEQMFFKAAARVSKEEDLSIFTHTDFACLGSEQADFLIGEGVEPKRIMIGHCCTSTDLSYMVNILEKGVYIGFDRFGIEGILGTPTDTLRIACLVGLLAMGYEDRIMLSQDYITYWYARPVIDQILGTFLPNWHSTHLFEDILPRLKEAGVSDEQINTMTVDNPRRFLTGE